MDEKMHFLLKKVLDESTHYTTELKKCGNKVELNAVLIGHIMALLEQIAKNIAIIGDFILDAPELIQKEGDNK